MELFFYTILFVFWTLFGSFSSVIIYRLKTWESWILTWRSHCPKCNHILWSLELIPIISWIKNLWKCNYCRAKISSIYPFLELSMWLLFTLIWYFLIDFNLIINWDLNEIIKLFFWLIIWFITIVYSFYDILFLEIHDWVMISWIVLSIIFIILESFWITNTLSYLNSFSQTDILLNIISIIILISTIWLLYIIMFKELKLIYDFIILFWIWVIIYLFLNLTNSSYLDFIAINSSIWIILIFSFLFIQIAISDWKWMGWWDLRIAILLWILVWFSFSIETLFFTYIIWSIISVLILLIEKIKKWFSSQTNTQVPFWPFLALWFFTAIFMQKSFNELALFYF